MSRTSRARRRMRGYTIVEMMIVLAFLPVLITAVAKAVSSSGNLAEESRAELHAHEELRKNLESVANVVRTADIDTIDGFDVNGIATAPEFSRVIGADAEGRLYDPVEQLVWVATGEDVDGVASPGVVVHRRGTQDRVVARNVPLGGFHIQLEDGTVVIRMASYYVTSSRKLAQVTAETSVALRN